jgi:peptide/nickel transport system substrate-binding protein
MRNRRGCPRCLAFVLLIALLFSAACSPSDPGGGDSGLGVQSAPLETAASQDAAAGAGNAPSDSKEGGTFVWVFEHDTDSLDPTFSTNDIGPKYLIGAPLVIRDPIKQEYVPYVAERWEISDDGLIYDFYLKEGVKFHDGSPCTASDWAWTFNRAIDPETSATLIAFMLEQLDHAEAVDDNHLRLYLKAPYYPFLENLTYSGWLTPLKQSYYEEMGPNQYTSHPIGIGPYKFVEWKKGEVIVLERNPDFAWGPDYGSGGPFNIERIEFRIIPEYATILSMLEAGQVDFARFAPKDLDLVRAMDDYEVYEAYFPGGKPMFTMDVSKPPFDDIRVRKAMNYAIDQQEFINIAALGHAVPMCGPASPGQIGYWPGIEDLCYEYDLDKAKALMAEAGWTLNDEGVLEKDGQTMDLELRTYTTLVKEAELAQQQLAKLGVRLSIRQDQEETLDIDWVVGNTQLAMGTFRWSEIDIWHMVFHSSSLGVLNVGNVNDPELDRLLALTRSTLDPTERQQYANEAQKRINEQAYTIPIYVLEDYFAVNKRLKEALWAPERALFFGLVLDNAYLEQ